MTYPYKTFFNLKKIMKKKEDCSFLKIHFKMQSLGEHKWKSVACGMLPVSSLLSRESFSIFTCQVDGNIFLLIFVLFLLVVVNIRFSKGLRLRLALQFSPSAASCAWHVFFLVHFSQRKREKLSMCVCVVSLCCVYVLFSFRVSFNCQLPTPRTRPWACAPAHPLAPRSVHATPTTNHASLNELATN